MTAPMGCRNVWNARNAVCRRVHKLSNIHAECALTITLRNAWNVVCMLAWTITHSHAECGMWNVGWYINCYMLNTFILVVSLLQHGVCVMGVAHVFYQMFESL